MNIERYVEPSKIRFEKHSCKAEEKKLCNIITSDIDKNAEIGLVGIPYDGGVELSNGRTGARKAPDSIREQLKKYGTTFNIDYFTDMSDLNIADFGNIIINQESSMEIYQRISKVIYEMTRNDVIPLVLGGGHDITYPCICGFSQHYPSIGGINIDVHFDVREQTGKNVSSGMGFRKILDSISHSPLKGNNFVEIGADGNVNSKEHYDYLKDHDITVFPIKFIRDSISNSTDIELFMNQVFSIAGRQTDGIFASLDIDSVSSDAAPGCSFTNPNGFNTDEISRIAHAIGFNPQVKYFDIAEVNPEFDVDDRTSRLCARIISCFLTGYKQRKKSVTKILELNTSVR